MPNLAKLAARLKPLFKLKALPGWILALPAVGRWLYKIVDLSSNLDWVYTVLRSGWVTAAWKAVISPTGSFVTMVLGIGWIAIVVARDKPQPLEQSEQRKELAPRGSVDLEVHDSLHGCPNPKIHQLEKDDQYHVWRLVKPITVSCDLYIEPNGPPPYIIFRFAIFSLTLREVSINDEIAGAIVFKVPEHAPWRLRRDISIEENEANEVLFRGSYVFKVRQDLTREDADYIRDNLEIGSFIMDHLEVRVSGDGVNEQRLDTRFSVKATEYYQPRLTDFLFSKGQG